MKEINTKQVVPIITAVIGGIFALVGVLQLGFWDSMEGPKPGFFPTIMSIVMILTSILAFIQSLKETEQAEYKKDEIYVILVGVGIFATTFVIGLVPTCISFVVGWLRFYEKEGWRNIAIVTAVVAIIAIVIFGMWLGIQFPKGIFDYL